MLGGDATLALINDSLEKDKQCPKERLDLGDRKSALCHISATPCSRVHRQFIFFFWTPINSAIERHIIFSPYDTSMNPEFHLPSISPKPGDPGEVCCREISSCQIPHVNLVEKILISESVMGSHKLQYMRWSVCHCAGLAMRTVVVGWLRCNVSI